MVQEKKKNNIIMVQQHKIVDYFIPSSRLCPDVGHKWKLANSFLVSDQNTSSYSQNKK